MERSTKAKPVESVHEISAITYGFMASKALFAALEFDLFTNIAQGADSTSALAKATGVAENRLVTLLAALKSLRLISEAGGRLINAPATSRYLVAGAPGDSGSENDAKRSAAAARWACLCMTFPRVSDVVS